MTFQAVWVEIPVKNLERATAFYKTVFELETSDVYDEGVRRHVTLVDPANGTTPGMSINETANFEPGDKGVLVYIHVGEDSAVNLARVEAAGGKIVENKTSMGATGFYATILDSEGNILALYSNH